MNNNLVDLIIVIVLVPIITLIPVALIVVYNTIKNVINEVYRGD
jgi:hypothetical protein